MADCFWWIRKHSWQPAADVPDRYQFGDCCYDLQEIDGHCAVYTHTNNSIPTS